MICILIIVPCWNRVEKPRVWNFSPQIEPFVSHQMIHAIRYNKKLVLTRGLHTISEASTWRMPKKRKSFTERRKEALRKKKETELESLCRRCGLCCHVKVGLSDGSYVLHPSVTCKYLTPDNLCSIYENRLMYDDKICFTREEMVNRDHLLPEGCPYSTLRQGYKSARVVSRAEFDEIVVRELEVGNYNILLAERAC